MKPTRPDEVGKLEELPNIGKAIAADLRAVGIMQPRQLAELAPLTVYIRLAGVMAQRHDPCVLYVLLAVRHFFDRGESRPWWQFAAEVSFGASQWSVIHIFRFRDDKIIEEWEASQQVLEDSPNENGIF